MGWLHPQAGTLGGRPLWEVGWQAGRPAGWAAGRQAGRRRLAPLSYHWRKKPVTVISRYRIPRYRYPPDAHLPLPRRAPVVDDGTDVGLEAHIQHPVRLVEDDEGAPAHVDRRGAVGAHGAAGAAVQEAAWSIPPGHGTGPILHGTGPILQPGAQHQATGLALYSSLAGSRPGHSGRPRDRPSTPAWQEAGWGIAPGRGTGPILQPGRTGPLLQPGRKSFRRPG
eukprot:gene6142-biopygen12226